MRVRIVSIAMLAALMITAPMLVIAQPKEIFIPLLVYRTDPYAPSGIPIADGFVDYFTLLHERRLRRPMIPMGVQLPDELLEPGIGRHSLHRSAGEWRREAEGQEDRPHLPQQRLQEGGEPDARGAREEVPVRADTARGGPSRAGAEGDVAPGATAESGLDLHVGLGRHEPG